MVERDSEGGIVLLKNLADGLQKNVRSGDIGIGSFEEGKGEAEGRE